MGKEQKSRSSNDLIQEGLDQGIILDQQTEKYKKHKITKIDFGEIGLLPVEFNKNSINHLIDYMQEKTGKGVDTKHLYTHPSMVLFKREVYFFFSEDERKDLLSLSELMDLMDNFPWIQRYLTRKELNSSK